MGRKTYALEIAYLLLTAKRPLSTAEIMERIGCNRKTVYSTIDAMELAGFVTVISNSGIHNKNLYEVKLG